MAVDQDDQAVGGVGAAGAYLAFAPEHYPGSLRDHSGLRGRPVEEPFQLPDFRVEPANPAIQVGIGRGGDTRTMLLKALDAIGGLTHFIQPGDVVLLSPACASFDQYRNFEERGEDFRSAVLALEPQGGPDGRVP
mgnify:CR=1 FL=1